MDWGWLNPRNWFGKKKDAGGRGYKGAAVNRKTAGWVTDGSSANAEVAKGGVKLRERARDLARNSPIAKRLVDAQVTYLVGDDGITPRAATGIPAVDGLLNAKHKTFANQCHINGDLTYGGQQRQAVRGMLLSGASFTRQRPRKMDARKHGRLLAVPMSLEVYEADFLDTHKRSDEAGRPVEEGMELNEYGAPEAFWFKRRHPGDTRFSMLSRSYESVRIDAETVAHLYDAIDRPGALNGVSFLHAVIQPIKDVEGFQDAIRVGNRARACLMAWISGGDYGHPTDRSLPNGFDPVLDNSGKVLQGFRSGSIAHLGDREIKFNDPTPAGNYEQHMREEKHAITAGVNIPYPVGTGDISKANFANIRFGFDAYNRWLRATRNDLIIPLWCNRVWYWFIDAMLASGALAEVGVDYEGWVTGPNGERVNVYDAVTWEMPAEPSVERYKDALADIMLIRGGLDSRQNVIRRRGRDPEDVAKEIEAENATADDKGFVFDTDPRRVSKAGVGQDVDID